MTTAHWLVTIPALLAPGVLAAIGVAARAQAEEPLQATLQAVAARRIFFGHQSVGLNLLEGLRELAVREGAALRVVDAGPGGVAPGTLAHAAMPENGDPMRKLRSFADAFRSGTAAGAEVALVKFCYLDITADTDVAALFAAYQRAMAEVQALSPGTTFVHVTAPLQTVEGGLRGSLKRLLGRPPWGTQHNARREEYNELLRAAYAGKAPLFDLARVESTLPDGGTETSPWNGRQVRALVPGFTDDGGHLNQAGRLRAAQELARVIATAPRRTAQKAAP